MKLFALLLIMPLFALAKGNFHNNKDTTKFKTSKSGKHHKKSRNFTNDIAFHYFGTNVISADSVIVQETFISSAPTGVKSLLMELDKENGEKFLSEVIEKYGMPIGDVIDVYEWAEGNIIFEIHETEKGYQATYKTKNFLK